jgi:protein CpxP
MKVQVVFKPLFVALLAATSLQAQTEQPPAPAKDAKVTPAERQQKHSDQIATELNLTTEQKAQFKKFDEEYAAKSKAMRTAQKEEATKLRAEKISAHKSVLTKEQAAKYDEIQAKKKARHADKMKKKGHHKGAQKEKKAEKKAIKDELDKH